MSRAFGMIMKSVFVSTMKPSETTNFPEGKSVIALSIDLMLSVLLVLVLNARQARVDLDLSQRSPWMKILFMKDKQLKKSFRV